MRTTFKPGDKVRRRESANASWDTGNPYCDGSILTVRSATRTEVSFVPIAGWEGDAAGWSAFCYEHVPADAEARQ